MDRLYARAPELVRVETDPEHTVAKIEAVLDDRVERAFSFGGDGTVGDVAAAVAERGIPVAVVPLGTTNVLARELGIPPSPKKALGALMNTERTVEHAAWWVDSRCVTLGVSAGFDAEIMHRTRPAMKARLGMAAVALRGAASLWSYDHSPMRVDWEDDAGRTDRAEARFVMASNLTRYAGPARVFPGADPTDGFLDVMFGPTRGILGTLGFWLRLFSGDGRQLNAPGVRSVRVRTLRVTAVEGGVIPVQVNGDAHGALPFEAVPGPRVRFLIPEDR